MVNDQDIGFLIKQTKLDKKRASLLVEEPRDLYLVLDSLSTRQLNEPELKELSLTNRFRLLFFKYSKDLDLSLENKIYVADCVSSQYLQLRKVKFIKRAREGKINERKSEETGKYYLAALCLHSHNFKKVFKGNHSIDFYLTHTTNAFNLCGKREFAKNLEKYISVFQKIRKEYLDKLAK